MRERRAVGTCAHEQFVDEEFAHERVHGVRDVRDAVGRVLDTLEPRAQPALDELDLCIEGVIETRHHAVRCVVAHLARADQHVQHSTSANAP
jgi:hypothetical protein